MKLHHEGDSLQLALHHLYIPVRLIEAHDKILHQIGVDPIAAPVQKGCQHPCRLPGVHVDLLQIALQT